MGKKYLDQSVVDVTFGAWWTEYGRSPATVQRALDRTRDQINGPGQKQGMMPPNYVPPPWRKNSRATGQALPNNGPTPLEVQQAQSMAPTGRRILENEINLLSAQRFPGLPPDVALQIMLVPCTANPAVQEARARAIIRSNAAKIEAYNQAANGPKAYQGPPRDIDREYEQRAAERDAIAALRRQSPMFNGPDGLARARELLSNRQAMMLLDLNYLANNTLAAGFYGIARQAGADHDSAMEIGKSSQNILEVTAAGGIMLGGRGRVRPGNRAGPRWTGNVKKGDYFPESGMPKNHFEAFQRTAKAEGKIVVVRFTKQASMKLIEQGAPAKGMDLSKAGIKCSTSTGIATAQGKTQFDSARKHGYYVVDADGVARDKAGQPLKFDGQTSWKLQPGQVIHPQQKKPVVGDYDLMDVIDPKAQGRRLVLASSDHKTLPDQSNPLVRSFLNEVNKQMDQPRVMHGAHTDFSGLPNEGAVVFRPDGTAVLLPDRDTVQGYYTSLGRPTRIGKHDSSGVKVGVE